MQRLVSPFVLLHVEGHNRGGCRTRFKKSANARRPVFLGAVVNVVRITSSYFDDDAKWRFVECPIRHYGIYVGISSYGIMSATRSRTTSPASAAAWSSAFKLCSAAFDVWSPPLAAILDSY